LAAISRLREDTERNEMAGEKTTLRQGICPDGTLVLLKIFVAAWGVCIAVGLCEVGSCQDLRPEFGEQTVGEIVDANGLEGKVLCGYQGWFSCPDDGSDLGWTHWSRSSRRPFGPGNVTVDLWPEVGELSAEERFQTGFVHADGRPAEVYSSAHPKTIHRHFQWMREYGIDGVFVQRFANGLKSPQLKDQKDEVLSNAKSAASKTGRVFAVMYDLSGLRAGQVSRVHDDWLQLRRDGITQGGRYLHHNGKPLVAVWGIGFSDDRQYTVAECGDLIDALKANGCAVMLGVPSWWREQNRDAVSDRSLHGILQRADILSPWTIGRYRSPREARNHATNVWKPDLEWCSQRRMDFLPVVYPGFSWKNLHGGKLNSIPRLKGEFLWSQMTAAKRIGAKMIYVAMFDEVDEGTAIFKCSNDPPVGNNVSFLTYEGLPVDHYLQLTGEGGRMLRGEIPAVYTVPATVSSPD
jgi:hypothetical protein